MNELYEINTYQFELEVEVMKKVYPGETTELNLVFEKKDQDHSLVWLSVTQANVNWK